MRKNSFFAVMGVIAMVSMAAICGCEKENKVVVEKSSDASTTQSKNVYIESFTPHFRWNTFLMIASPCNASGGYFCGYYVDDILTGDEVCFLMMLENNPTGYLTPYLFVMPAPYLIANGAGELVDSARHGYFTFHDDINFLSDTWRSRTGMESIPAGRYPAQISVEHGDTNVLINVFEPTR